MDKKIKGVHDPLIVISEPSGSMEAQRKVGQAALETADLILLEEAVPLALKGALDGFCGTAFACAEDIQKHDLQTDSIEKGVRVMSRDELRELFINSGGNPEEF